MMLNRVDFFKADRYMSLRVAEYARCRILKKEIQLAYAKKIDDINKALNNLANLKGSIIEKNIPSMRSAYLAQLAEYEKERDARIAEECKFEFTEHDKAFKKAMKNANTASDLQSDAVVAWFDVFGCDVRDSYFLDEVLAYFGGKFDFKQFVATNGEDGRVIDATRALDMMYWSAYTHMVRVGTIKATQIPELVREKYAPKPTKKSNKKAK